MPEIAELKTLLWINIAISTVLLVLYVFRGTIKLPIRQDHIERQDFYAEVQGADAVGDYARVIELCTKRTSDFPKDANAWLQLALAQYKAKQLPESLSSFEELRKIDNALFGQVDFYVEEIRTALESSE